MGTSTRSLLADPSVMAYVRTVLRRRGVPLAELDDGVATVQVLALEALKGRAEPADLRGWLRFAGRIACRHAVSEGRRRASRALYEVDVSGDLDCFLVESRLPDDGSTDVDHPLLNALYELVLTGELPASTLPLLHGKAAGLGHRALGEEIGLTERGVRDQLASLRRVLRAHVGDSFDVERDRRAVGRRRVTFTNDE